MSARVIRLTPDWAERIEGVERESFTVPWTMGMIRDALTSSRCSALGITEGGALYGYLCLSGVLDEGCVDKVAVAPG